MADSDLTTRARAVLADKRTTDVQRKAIAELASLPDSCGIPAARQPGRPFYERRDTNTMQALRARGITEEMGSWDGHWRLTADLGRECARLLAAEGGAS